MTAGAVRDEATTYVAVGGIPIPRSRLKKAAKNVAKNRLVPEIIVKNWANLFGRPVMTIKVNIMLAQTTAEPIGIREEKPLANPLKMTRGLAGRMVGSR
jgi:hypothetical protein